jgi:hypothetical protein
MTQHTPGPWQVIEGWPDIGIVTDKVLVAMVKNDEDSPCTDEEQAANARLIAAAPDLLAVCKDFAHALDGAAGFAHFHANGKRHKELLAAIARAEGSAAH